MKTLVRLAGVCALVVGLVSSPLGAAGFSTRPSSMPIPPAGAAPNAVGCGASIVTHSSSQAITAENSVSCNSSGIHADNSYFRAFDLAALGYADGFEICSVELGVELATAGVPATSQPVTVRLYQGPTGFPTGFPGSYTQIGTASLSVADQSATILAVPITASVPAGAELVMEVFTPDGSTAGHSFFIGSNAAAETGPSYLQAADCAINSPVTTAAIGFPNMHLVMNVEGDVPAPQPSVIEVPTLGSWGLGLLALFLGLSATLLLRRRTA